MIGIQDLKDIKENLLNWNVSIKTQYPIEPKNISIDVIDKMKWSFWKCSRLFELLKKTNPALLNDETEWAIDRKIASEVGSIDENLVYKIIAPINCIVVTTPTTFKVKFTRLPISLTWRLFATTILWERETLCLIKIKKNVASVIIPNPPI